MGVARQIRLQVFADIDRPDARAAAAMRNTECLMQIQMGDVRAELPVQIE